MKLNISFVCLVINLSFTLATESSKVLKKSTIVFEADKGSSSDDDPRILNLFRPRPPPPQQQQPQQQRPTHNGPFNNNNGPFNNNGQHNNNIPQSPTFPDLSSQGTGNYPIQQHPPNRIMMPGKLPQQQQQDTNQIPEVYIQIISAIEKLLQRMEKLDTRLKTLESVVYYITNKEKPEQGTCPEKYTRVDAIKGKCYHISSMVTTSSSPAIFDWKSASVECSKIGGRLVEMLNYEDFYRITQFLVKYTNSKKAVSTDFWIGGINPGLIWIWSESGQRVDMDKRFWNENDNSSNAPGCLKLGFSVRLNAYFFRSAPCNHPHNFICEIIDNNVARALAMYENFILAEDDTFSNSTTEINSTIVLN